MWLLVSVTDLKSRLELTSPSFPWKDLACQKLVYLCHWAISGQCHAFHDLWCIRLELNWVHKHMSRWTWSFSWTNRTSSYRRFWGPLLKVGHHFFEQESQTILLFRIYLFQLCAYYFVDSGGKKILFQSRIRITDKVGFSSISTHQRKKELVL